MSYLNWGNLFALYIAYLFLRLILSPFELFSSRLKPCRNCAETEKLLETASLKLVGANASYAVLLDKYRELVDQINRKGGQEFLIRGFIPSRDEEVPFDYGDLTKLIHLCHPDKHNNSKTAQDMTTMLLRLRNQQEGD